MTGNEWLVYVVLPIVVASLGVSWASYVGHQIKRNQLAEETKAKHDQGLKSLNAAE